MNTTRISRYITKKATDDLEARGYTVANVERWNHFAKIKQDLWGFADLIAFKKKEVLLIQTTSKSNMSARKKKIASNDTAKHWLSCGHKIEIQGWHKHERRWKADYITL